MSLGLTSLISLGLFGFTNTRIDFPSSSMLSTNLYKASMLFTTFLTYSLIIPENTHSPVWAKVLARKIYPVFDRSLRLRNFPQPLEHPFRINQRNFAPGSILSTANQSTIGFVADLIATLQTWCTASVHQRRTWIEYAADSSTRSILSLLMAAQNCAVILGLHNVMQPLQSYFRTSWGHPKTGNPLTQPDFQLSSQSRISHKLPSLNLSQMLQDRNSTLQSVVPLVQGFARSLDAPPVSGMLSFATQVPPFPLDLIRGGNIFNRRAFIVGRSLLGVGMFIIL